MKKGKQKFVGIIVWGILIVLAITLPQIDYQVAGVVAILIGVVGLVALFKPLKRVGLDKRGKAFFLVAISLVMIIGSAQVFRADQDQILAGLKETDTAQYLIKLKEFRGEEVWLEELKVLAPDKYDLEQARITTEAEEGKARANSPPASKVASATGETTIGRWCDRMIPNSPKYNRTMTIKVNDNGMLMAFSRFGDGSTNESKLTERSGGVFFVNGSSSGDRYRIIPATGNIQLIDNDGLIRVANRLENEPRLGDCLP